LQLQQQPRGSAGETLSVGYAFLSTLFNRNRAGQQHDLPFVVDNPANTIDIEVRGRIGELVPKLTRQFVGFIISSERDAFLENLRTASNSDIRYITLFRKGIDHLETRAQGVASCAVTDDGILVTDRQFFDEFQLNAEAV
ncbi:MAG: hypothetical protein OXJ64_17690, partial [Boseongicola sp.]|nr:hypothetical protein [Boseongicola sp.]